MENPRKYGKPPYNIVVVHGGPGAAGEMAPVARELSSHHGILEPLQTETTITAQISELKTILEEKAKIPVILIGHSWGAWLSTLLSAGYPELVRKLILLGSGPFEEKYASDIMKTRLGRLRERERKELLFLMEGLNGGMNRNAGEQLNRLGKLIAKSDSFDPMKHEDEVPEFRHEIYSKIWGEAQKMRSRGELLEYAKNIKCPVVAIHGDYDPHPPQGIKALSGVFRDFRLILIKDCGHQPWYERKAKNEFYKILKYMI